MSCQILSFGMTLWVRMTRSDMAMSNYERAFEATASGHLGSRIVTADSLGSCGRFRTSGEIRGTDCSSRIMRRYSQNREQTPVKNTATRKILIRMSQRLVSNVPPSEVSALTSGAPMVLNDVFILYRTFGYRRGVRLFDLTVPCKRAQGAWPSPIR